MSSFMARGKKSFMALAYGTITPALAGSTLPAKERPQHARAQAEAHTTYNCKSKTLIFSFNLLSLFTLEHLPKSRAGRASAPVYLSFYMQSSKHKAPPKHLDTLL